MKTAAAIITLLAWLAGIAVAHAETVDLLLVLAADVSRSIDDVEFNLQRKGYAAAITDPRVLRAISGGRRRHHGQRSRDHQYAGQSGLCLSHPAARRAAKVLRRKRHRRPRRVSAASREFRHLRRVDDPQARHRDRRRAGGL